MEFNKIYFSIISILGILLLYSYYYFLNLKKSNLRDLWGRIKTGTNFYNFYLISMIIAALGFLLMMYYLLVGNLFTQKDITHLFISSLVILVASLLWMPLSLEYIRHPSLWLKMIIIIILLMVACAGYYIILRLYWINDRENKSARILSILGMIYFFFHTFILDAIIWSRNFF
jgi:hypothetical protein